MFGTVDDDSLLVTRGLFIHFRIVASSSRRSLQNNSDERHTEEEAFTQEESGLGMSDRLGKSSLEFRL